MYTYIVYCLNIFFIILDAFVLVYIIRNLLPLGRTFKVIVEFLAAPIIEPMQKIIKHSIMNCFNIDLSPYILFILLGFLQEICGYFLKVG